jgi:mannitol/fructose-specific phosphotransferase system IIA component (Ntr-type)
VHLVFLLATPGNNARNDQALMAGVLRLHMEPPLRTRLSAARDRGELFDVLSQVSLPVLVDVA